MSMTHPVILTDIRGGRILVADLDKNDPLAEPLWEWYPTEELGWKTTRDSLKEALSEVKVRWSAYHNARVVLFCSSRGAVGMAAYPSGKCLWEAMVGVSPHAIEMLPNGDIVVAASGGGEGEKGRIHYLSLTENGNYTPAWEFALYGGHGVVWDPAEKILWASGTYDVVALTTKGEQIEGKGARIPCGYGHDLMQDLSNPDILWVSPSPVVFQFSKSRNALQTEFCGADVIHPLLRAKGIASFPDGVVVWVAYGHHTSSEHPDHFSALWPGKGVITYTHESAGWNKVRIFSDRYT